MRNKLFSFLNFLGLAIGLACTLCIYLWVNHELSFDSFHKNKNQLYLVELLIEGWDNSVVTPAPLAPALLEEYADIKNATRFSHFGDGRLLTYNDKAFKEIGIKVDSSFFNMFSFKFLKGNAEAPFENAESIIITEKLAKKYFGDEEAIGKVIVMDHDQEFSVSGVLEEIPDNSSLQFDFVIHFKPYSGISDDDKEWAAWFCGTILQLNNGVSGEELINKTEAFSGLFKKIDRTRWSSQLIPFTEVYFKDNMQPFLSKTGNWKHIKIFSISGILLVIVTCMNYISLSTARFMHQFKQFGIRKLLGAENRNMMGQYFIEATFYASVAIVFALFLITYFQPIITNISGKVLEIPLLNVETLFRLIALILFTSVFACSFPFMFLSKIKPLTSLQGVQNMKPGGISLRQGLVVFQFAITTCLIICTLVLHRQLQFINKKDVGYNKENLLSINLTEEIADKVDFLKSELLRHPQISGVSASTFEHIYFDTKITDWEGKTSEESLTIRPMDAQPDFLETFGIELKSGRFYREGFNDSASLVINQTAAKKMGLSAPVGKKVQLPWEKEKRTVIGVVKDFNYQGLTKEIEPLFIFEGNSGNLFIRINESNKPLTLAYIQQVFKKLNPLYPSEYTFLEDRFKLQHVAQHQTAEIFKFFSGISIFISCLSLFAMASFTAERRSKEISIRKLNGASVTTIVQMLSKDFFKMVVVAFIVASPVAYYIMSQWLENFAYRISLPWGVFLIAGLITILIALITISFQSIKAAMVNPVDSLRNE